MTNNNDFFYLVDTVMHMSTESKHSTFSSFTFAQQLLASRGRFDLDNLKKCSNLTIQDNQHKELVGGSSEWQRGLAKMDAFFRVTSSSTVFSLGTFLICVQSLERKKKYSDILTIWMNCNVQRLIIGNHKPCFLDCRSYTKTSRPQPQIKWAPKSEFFPNYIKNSYPPSWPQGSGPAQSSRTCRQW